MLENYATVSLNTQQVYKILPYFKIIVEDDVIEK